jgi:hypothetical protein
MGPRFRVFGQVVAAGSALALADQVARHLDLVRASGLLCLASLATVVICARLGWRQALLGVVGLALLTIPAALSQGDPLLAVVVMMFTAFGLGLSARWQLQQVYWLMVVSLVLLITNSPFSSLPNALDLVRLGVAVLISGTLAILLQIRLVPRDRAKVAPALFPVAHSWRRSAAYGALLATTTLVSTAIALHQHWRVSGLWLILVPFLVLRPFVRDAWKVALHRSLGTVAGVVLVVALAAALPPGLPLQVPAILLGAVTALIAIRHGHPALMITALTATIVLFNSNSSDLILMDDKRLEANVLGVAIALASMAIAQPIERWFLLRREPEVG